MRPISHEKMNHLGEICVTMTYLMNKFYEKTELSDVICEECTLSSSTTRNPVLKKKSVLKSPMQLRISLQISYFNFEKDVF